MNSYVAVVALAIILALCFEFFRTLFYVLRASFLGSVEWVNSKFKSKQPIATERHVEELNPDRYLEDRSEFVTRYAVEMSKQKGAKSAREAAEIVEGRKLSESEWAKVKDSWESRW